MAAFGWLVCGLAVFLPIRLAADWANGTPVSFWSGVLIGVAWTAAGVVWKKVWEALP